MHDVESARSVDVVEDQRMAGRLPDPCHCCEMNQSVTFGVENCAPHVVLVRDVEQDGASVAQSVAAPRAGDDLMAVVGQGSYDRSAQETTTTGDENLHVRRQPFLAGAWGLRR